MAATIRTHSWARARHCRTPLTRGDTAQNRLPPPQRFGRTTCSTLALTQFCSIDARQDKEEKRRRGWWSGGGGGKGRRSGQDWMWLEALGSAAGRRRIRANGSRGGVVAGRGGCCGWWAGKVGRVNFYYSRKAAPKEHPHQCPDQCLGNFASTAKGHAPVGPATHTPATHTSLPSAASARSMSYSMRDWWWLVGTTTTSIGP